MPIRAHMYDRAWDRHALYCDFNIVSQELVAFKSITAAEDPKHFASLRMRDGTSQVARADDLSCSADAGSRGVQHQLHLLQILSGTRTDFRRH